MKLNQLFLLTLLVWSCNEESSYNEVAPCIDKTGLTRVSILKDVSGVIKKHNDFGVYEIYELEPNEFGIQLPLRPCNLPNDFELENLVVRFSGNLMETEFWEIYDNAVQPFELTDIDSVVVD